MHILNISWLNVIIQENNSYQLFVFYVKSSFRGVGKPNVEDGVRWDKYILFAVHTIFVIYLFDIKLGHDPRFLQSKSNYIVYTVKYSQYYEEMMKISTYNSNNE